MHSPRPPCYLDARFVIPTSGIPATIATAARRPSLDSVSTPATETFRHVLDQQAHPQAFAPEAALADPARRDWTRRDHDGGRQRRGRDLDVRVDRREARV